MDEKQFKVLYPNGNEKTVLGFMIGEEDDKVREAAVELFTGLVENPQAISVVQV